MHMIVKNILQFSELQHHFHKMSQNALILEGLKSHKCKHRVPQILSPLHLTPMKSTVDDVRTAKFKVDDDFEEKINIFWGDTTEGHVFFMRTCKGFLQKK